MKHRNLFCRGASQAVRQKWALHAALRTANAERTLYLYGAIGDGFGEIDTASTVKAIESGEVDTIAINSPGGDVFDALAIEAAIRRRANEITVRIDGLAASAASFVGLGAHRVVIAPHAEVMIHEPWTIAIGGAVELTEAAARLDAVAEKLASIYSARGKLTHTRARELMRAETWLSAAEAIESGLADSIESEESTEKAAATQSDRAKAWIDAVRKARAVK